MDKSTFKEHGMFISEIFRTPLSAEREIGLWVDRIGVGYERRKPDKLRVLGLYAAVCIESGSGFYYSDANGERAVNKGDTIIVFPDMPYICYSTKTGGSRFVVWSGPEASKLETLGFLSRENIIIPNSADVVIEANKALLEIINREDLNSILERKNIALNMILKLHKRLEAEKRCRPVEISIEKTISYMCANYNKELSVKECAMHACLSETHFRRLFKASTGRSPKEFMLSLKISKAKELLSRGVSIKETATLVGWDDIFYFMRIFKKISGLSPGKFQRK
ncbi:MAG: helix-turn-helix transcriptional regulator [Victivallaceae bacterium]|nr:helix-turn-helix transcriptional regulator [Victivallaceae bacterium]